MATQSISCRFVIIRRTIQLHITGLTIDPAKRTAHVKAIQRGAILPVERIVSPETEVRPPECSPVPIAGDFSEATFLLIVA